MPNEIPTFDDLVDLLRKSRFMMSHSSFVNAAIVRSAVVAKPIHAV